MRVGTPPIPKEHGAWAVLLVPLLLGASVAGGTGFGWVWLVCSALMVFMSYVPAKVILRNAFVQSQPAWKVNQSIFWWSLYMELGLLFITPLLISGRWLLLPLGLLALGMFLGSFLAAQRHPKSLAGDLLAVAGLALSAPAAYYVGTGALDGTALEVWLLNALFFSGTTLYVGMKIRAAGSKAARPGWKEKLSLGGPNVVYQAAVLGGVAAIDVIQHAGAFAFLAYFPFAAHAVYGTLALSSRVRFRRLGLMLLAHSLLFALLLRVLP